MDERNSYQQFQMLEDMGVRIHAPGRQQFHVGAYFNSIRPYNQKTDEKYEKRILQLVSQMNKGEAKWMDNIHVENRQGMFRYLQGVQNFEGQREILNFMDMFGKGYTTYDIETIGDAMNRTGYSITEIAAQGFEQSKDGNYREASNRFFALMAPQQEVVKHMQEKLKALANDPFAFNTFTEAEKRSLIDLMRYSSRNFGDDTNQAAVFNKTGDIVSELTHNSVVQNLTQDEVIHESKIVQNMRHYLQYMNQGLNDLVGHGEEATSALTRYAAYLRTNAGSHFVSHNGVNFDLPVLRDYAKKLGVDLSDPNKHVDFLRLIQTVYPDMDELHMELIDEQLRRQFPDLSEAEIQEKINEVWDNRRFTMGKAKLQEMRISSGFSTNAGHNAQYDIGSKGLGGVLDLVMNAIDSRIEEAKVDFKPNYEPDTHPGQFKWSDRILKEGDLLFAPGGFNVYQDGDSSFQYTIDQDGNILNHTNDFNKTVVNSKTFYRVNGLMDFGKNEEGIFQYGLSLYDEANERGTMIIRQGHTEQEAFDQIASFVQRRFFAWDDIDEATQKRIEDLHLTDQARRKYESLFTIQRAGAGRSQGYEAAMRFYTNAKMVQDHWNQKDSVLKREAKRYAKQYGVTEREAFHILAEGRMTHDEMTEKLDFNSKWVKNPLDGERWVYNEGEEKLFWKMSRRLTSESEHFLDALKEIERRFSLENVTDEEEKKRIKKQRDIAWRNYYNTVNEHLESQGKSMTPDKRTLWQFENRRVEFEDFLDPGRTVNMNFQTAEDAVGSVVRYVFDKDLKEIAQDDLQLNDMRRERFVGLVKGLRQSGIINNRSMESILGNAEKDVTGLLQYNETAYDLSRSLALLIYEEGKYNKNQIETTSLQVNQGVKNLSKKMNAMFIHHAIQDTHDMSAQLVLKGVPGKQVNFSEQLESLFKYLDEKQLSGLSPNNRKAIESMLAKISDDFVAKYDGHFLNTALSFNEDMSQAKISIFHAKDSSQVMEQLMDGKAPTKALELILPMIQRNGTQVIGNQILNAHTIAQWEAGGENGKIVFKSSAEAMADAYMDDRRFGWMMKNFLDGKVDYANDLGRRTLREEVNKLSGVMRNLGGANDTLHFANNQSDFNKQSMVKLQNAMIHHWYATGKLKRNDFHAGALNQDGTLKPTISLDDVKFKKSYEMLMEMPNWIQQFDNTQNLVASTIKDAHLSKMIMSQVDIRDYIPYAHFIFQGRGNSIQGMNTHILHDDVTNRMLEVSGKHGMYLNFDDMLITSAQEEYNRTRNPGGVRSGFNAKVKYMNQEEINQRMRELAQTDEGRDILKEAGLLDANGNLDELSLKKPRVFEQQGVIAKELAEQIKVKEFKAFNIEDPHAKLWTQEGDIVKPGQIIGTQRVNGKIKDVVYDGKYEGKLELTDGRWGVSYTDEAFKFMADGEKFTDFRVSHRLIQALADNDEVSIILSPDIAKHSDYGMLMAGHARNFTDYINQLQEKHDRVGTKKQRKIQSQINRAIQAIEGGGLGLKWEEGNRRFVDQTPEMIKSSKDGQIHIGVKAFDQVYDKLKEILPDMDIDSSVLISKVGASKVGQYAKVIDADGYRVVMHEDGTMVKMGQPGSEGVNWGHREMGVLQREGYDKTYEHVFNVMKHQAETKGPDVSRMQEFHNTVKALSSFTEEIDNIDSNQVLKLNDFRNLPDIHRDPHTFANTIFNKAFVQEKLGAGYSNPHGYWLELPEIEMTGGKGQHQITVQTGQGAEGRKAINKIFVPFSNLDNTGGDIYLREMQQHIADIYEKANRVNKATSTDKAVGYMNELQGSVDKYIQNLVTQVSSSKGLAGSDVFKANMGQSATGIFKLMDVEQSMKHEGEFTFISENDAKKMGIHDQLLDIEKRRAAGEVVDDLFTMNVRYPTFHNEAMQVTKIRMSKDVKDGEFHTTSFTAKKAMRGDSDGDYNNIVVLDDAEIQKEWKQKYEQRQKEIAGKYQEWLAGEDPLKFHLADVIQGDRIESMKANQSDEIAAKIGKVVIGKASNLNFYARQMAQEFLSHDKQKVQDVETFFGMLEQKPISSKHGMKVDKMFNPAVQMINHIYAGEWEKALQIDQDWFDGDFSKKHRMKEALFALDEAYTRMDKGLRSEGFRFGTSYGASAEDGISKVLNLIHGTGKPDEMVRTNPLLNLMHRAMNVSWTGRGEEVTEEEWKKLDPFQLLQSQEASPRRTGPAGTLGNLAEDATGGWRSLGDRTTQFFENLMSSPQKKWGMMGGGLALAGLAGYNVLSNDDPVVPFNNPIESPYSYSEERSYVPQAPMNPAYDYAYNPPSQPSSPYQPTAQPVVYQAPKPALSPVGGGYEEHAQIAIQAKGSGIGQRQLTSAVGQGMQGSGMNGGRGQMSVNVTDNTANLNRIWYRDTVEEYA